MVNVPMPVGMFGCYIKLNVEDIDGWSCVLGKDWVFYFQEYLIQEWILLPNVPDGEIKMRNTCSILDEIQFHAQCQVIMLMTYFIW